MAQPHKTWAALSKHGQVGLEQFNTALDTVAKAMGLRVDVQLPEGMTEEHQRSDDGFLFVAPLKSAKRAKEKVGADYDGDFSKLKDVIRATISVGSMAEIHEAIAKAKAAGLTLAAKPKDRFAKPTAEGYRDLTTLVKLPNGMLGELQFHLKSMTAAKNEAHAHYETTRSLSAKHGEAEPTDAWPEEDHAAFYDARKKGKAIYDGAWNQAGSG